MCGSIHKDDRFFFYYSQRFCLCRRKSDLSIEEDNHIAVSANAAYDDVTWKAEEREREHENLGMVVRSSQHTVEYTGDTVPTSIVSKE